VTDELLARIAADARISIGSSTPISAAQTLLVEFVCVATGGPCKYTGATWSSHAGMELVDDEFTALVEDLAGALDKFRSRPATRPSCSARSARCSRRS